MTMSPSPGTSGSHVAGLVEAGRAMHARSELHAEQVAEIKATATARTGRFSRLLAKLRRS
jgi:hypothetical protein